MVTTNCSLLNSCFVLVVMIPKERGGFFFFFSSHPLQFGSPGPRGLLTASEIQDKKVMHREGHSPDLSFVWRWVVQKERRLGSEQSFPGEKGCQGPVGGWRPRSRPAEGMVLAVGWLLCAFGGQCFGLENSCGRVSVVKYVWMNEQSRRELWRVVSVEERAVEGGHHGKEPWWMQR